ncbi:hypothetical protein ACO0M4_12470 [Streptomyces sp. RGM 3693]|uniref:hypothetical protein n=1 Tax=Streptomyces sp. RGM 3693 TaxID=3413284 RepID=UPI003D284587
MVMLFSIPEYGWWLIAVASTVFLMLGLWLVAIGTKLPEDLRSTGKQSPRRSKWAAALLAPVVFGAILGMNLLRPEPAPEILFLYSVVCTSMPIALVPVRGRMLREYVEQKRRNPDGEVQPDGLTMAWILSVLSVMCLAAVIALMTVP